MMIQARLGALKGIKPHEYAVRFLFGGACTAAAGLIATHFGPELGGLFMAFPAIFPAGACLIESHEKLHKERIGADGTRRGRAAASVDAAGASIGCIGLIGFALVLWAELPRHRAMFSVLLASLAWLLLSVVFWWVRKSRILRRRRVPS